MPIPCLVAWPPPPPLLGAQGDVAPCALGLQLGLWHGTHLTLRGAWLSGCSVAPLMLAPAQHWAQVAPQHLCALHPPLPLHQWFSAWAGGPRESHTRPTPGDSISETVLNSVATMVSHAEDWQELRVY